MHQTKLSWSRSLRGATGHSAGFALAYRVATLHRVLVLPMLATSRDLRGQLERALQEAEAYRADKHTASDRADLCEGENTELEAR